MKVSFQQKIKTHLKDILSIDFFAMRPSERITFDKSQKFSTLIGKFASWVLISLIILTFINFGGGMIYHENPQSVISQIVTPDPAYLDLPASGFFMAFGLQDLRNYSHHYIDETIYNVKMIQRTKVGSNISLESIPIKRCSIDLVPDRDDLQDYYSRNQINYLYCISNSSSIESALQSTWDGPLYRNLLINIYPCSNSTGNVVCKPLDVIQGYLNNANYAMYFTNLAIDPSNYEKPITTFAKQLYTPISFSTLTYIEMTFGHLDFISDNGFLFEELNTTSTATYLANRQILSFSSSMIVQIDMKLDKVKNIYKRSYDKIQGVLANMGGIIKAFTVLANFFVLPLVTLRFRLNLANKMFNFKASKNGKTIKPHVHKSKGTVINVNTANYSIKSDKSKDNRKMNSSATEKLKNYFNPRSNKIDLSYFEYFFSFCQNEISKIYKILLNKGLNQIDQALDISYIMNKLTEIDVLKVLLLDETQIDLFEYIPKPEISLEDDSKNMSNNTHNKLSKNFGRTNSNKAQLAYEAFHVICGKKDKTILDEKLIEMVPKLFKKQKSTNFKTIHITNSHEAKDLFQVKQDDLKDLKEKQKHVIDEKINLEIKNKIIMENFG